MNWKAEAERMKFDDGMSWGEIARQLQVCFPDLNTQQTLEKIRGYIRGTERYKQINKPNNDTDQYEKSSIEYKQDGTTVYDKLITICESDEMTPEYLLKAHGLDAEKWKVISYKNNYWHTQVKGGKRLLMYQSKITVKPYEDKEISPETAKRVFEELSSNYNPKPIQYIIHRQPQMLEVNIADLHLGKLAWGGECAEDYDYKIARDRFNYVIDDVISRIQNRPIEKIIMPVGNDFFNSDTIDGTTTKGTIQTNDLRWKKLYKVGCLMLTDAVDKLRQIAPIECFYVSANHDKMVSYYATDHVETFFRNVESVSVETTTKYRKYIEYGNSLIGFAHGNEEGKRIFNLMPVEAREAWGRTRYHEFHIAHIHSEKAVQAVQEEAGLICRYVSSITSSDAWHEESAFVGAVKKSQNFIYDRDKGLVDIINSVI